MASPSMPDIPRATAEQFVACLDAGFEDFAQAFARGEYVLWLGSGLSREVVPDVSALLEKLLSHLQERVSDDDEGCQFSRALNEIVEMANLSTEEREAIDLSEAVSSWTGLKDLIARLVPQYSKVLDVVVDGEERDYLVWDGIDAAGTYGDETLVPAAEHLCVAILMLEGVVRSAPTTNWDNLVELAVERLSEQPNVLRVVVHQGDFLEDGARADLIKFHGCAARAKAEPENYRALLVARRTQISGWTALAANKIIKDHLEHLVATRPALVVGLSAQDANIHTILQEARESLKRPWPDSPPGVAFALQQLGPDQTHVLEITYGDDYFPNRGEIASQALLGGYARPVLLGLVLFTLSEKLCSLIEAVVDFDGPGVARLREGVVYLRNQVSKEEGDPQVFVEQLISATRSFLTMFRTGLLPEASANAYVPLSAQPIPELVSDPNIRSEVLGAMAVSLSLLGRGCADGDWELTEGPGGSGDARMATVIGASATSQVFVAESTAVVSTLVAEGYVDVMDPDVLVLQAADPAPRAVRSPRLRLGRNGNSGSREVSMASLIRDAEDTDDLYELFRLEAGI